MDNIENFNETESFIYRNLKKGSIYRRMFNEIYVKHKFSVFLKISDGYKRTIEKMERDENLILVGKNYIIPNYE